jgi:hypothetical protein
MTAVCDEDRLTFGSFLEQNRFAEQTGQQEAEMKTPDLDCIRFVTRHFHDLQGLRFWVPLGLITLSLGGTTYFERPPILILRAALFLGGLLLMLWAARYYKRFGVVEQQLAEPAEKAASLSIYSPAGPLPGLRGFQPVPPAVQRFVITMGLACGLFLIVYMLNPAIRIEQDESFVQPPWATLDSVVLASPSWTRGIQTIVKPVPVSTSTVKAFFAQMLYVLYGTFFLCLWFWRGRRPSQSYPLVFGALLLALAVLGVSLGHLVWAEGPVAEIVSLFVPATVHLWTAVLLCGGFLIIAGTLDHRQLVRTLGRT